MGNDSCRLIALNMFGCVNNPFTPHAIFNFDTWYTITYKAMRLMDDLVDLELEHIQRIINKIDEDDEPEFIKQTERKIWTDLERSGMNARRTGLGFTALGDVLASLGIKYDSKEALEFVEQVMTVKLEAELDATIDLAKERGPFPDWDKTLEKRNSRNEDSFFRFIRETYPKQWRQMKKYGRRNISWSTVAPTGSLSILTQTTSGIEPLYQPYYTRRVKINPSEESTKVDFVDESGDKWQEYIVIHPKFKDWILKQTFVKSEEDNTSIDIEDINQSSSETLERAFELSPWYKATATDIDWKFRVAMQAIIQKYTTHSISSTINMPSTVTVDTVKDIYFNSWQQGLKGVTIYRDGSRSGVLITKKSFEPHNAPKRPKELLARFHAVKSQGEWFGVIIGFLEGKPYEVFAYPNPASHTREVSGKVIKEKSGVYHFSSLELDIPDLNHKEKYGDIQLVTRMISGFLRHSAGIQWIISQINKCPLDIVSLGTAIKRVLLKYVDGAEIKGITCQSCNSENVVMQEGCITCRDCGSSKCG